MSLLRHKKIVVFGGTGFVGRYVVRKLAAAGARIAVPTRNIESAKFLRPMGDVGQITPVALSLADDAAIRQLIAGADAVINCIGILYESGKSGFEKIHHQWPKKLAKLAHECNVKKLVQISSLGVDAAKNSRYAQSKLAGERAVMADFPSAVILRPSVIFGAEDNFFNQFAAMAKLAGILPLIGGGHTRFQPVFVGDVADAVLRVIANPESGGQIYELAGPNTYSFRELLLLMLKITGQKACLISIPAPFAKIKAAFLQLLPKPLLTVDQVRLLAYDNIVKPGRPGFADLGIVPVAAETILPSYLDRFRDGGRLANTNRVA